MKRARIARAGWLLLASSSVALHGTAVAQVDAARGEGDARKAAAPDASVAGATDEYAQVVRLAVDAYNRDDFASARQYFARAHELRPSARTWRGLGTTAFELKYFDDAVRELTFALEDQRSALTPELKAETELTLRVARRRLSESEEEAKRAMAPAGAAAAVPPSAASSAEGVQLASTGSDGPGLGGQRIAAIAVGAAGVVGVALGVGFGLRSMAKGRQRDRLCPDHDDAPCSAAGVAAADSAIAAGDVSTVAWVAGGVALAGGVLLWVTGAPDEQRPAAARLSFGPGGLALSGSF